jgi:hypothetical protein
MQETNQKKLEHLPHCQSRECIWLFLIFGIFIILNLVTSTRSPTVWQDEVMFADPAINLVSHGKWVSTAWFAQTVNEFWMGNAPLYPALLAVWIKVFGTSITGVRSLNYFFTALAALLLWSWSYRANTVSKPWTRLLMVSLVLTGQGMAFSYRSGRYDALGYLLVITGLWAFTLNDSRIRYSLLAVVGFLLPWAGLQLLPFVSFVGAVSLLVFASRFLMEWVWAAFGAVAGGCVFGAILKFTGLWKPFWSSVNGLSGSHTPLEVKLKSLVGIYVQDQSYLPLLAAVALLVLIQRRHISAFTLKMALITGGIAVFLPATLHLLAKFPIYYTWMAFIPLAILAAHLLSFPDAQTKLLKKIALVCLVISILAGLPARLAVTVLQWRERDYAPVRALAQRTITKADCVYAAEQGYYAVKPIAHAILLPEYRPVMSPIEKEQITCLFINPSDFEYVTNFLGGKWTDTGEFVAPEQEKRSFGAAKYNLHVWRRASI